jgi:hypothetical protein
MKLGFNILFKKNVWLQLTIQWLLFYYIIRHFVVKLLWKVLGDSNLLWISMATMYENVCGNCVGGVELTFVWHFICVHLIFFYIIAHWLDNFQNFHQRQGKIFPCLWLPPTLHSTLEIQPTTLFGEKCVMRLSFSMSVNFRFYNSRF